MSEDSYLNEEERLKAGNDAGAWECVVNEKDSKAKGAYIISATSGNKTDQSIRKLADF